MIKYMNKIDKDMLEALKSRKPLNTDEFRLLMFRNNINQNNLSDRTYTLNKKGVLQGTISQWLSQRSETIQLDTYEKLFGALISLIEEKLEND